MAVKTIHKKSIDLNRTILKELNSVSNAKLEHAVYAINYYSGHTECVRDLYKLNLVKLGNAGSVIGLSQFFLLFKLPEKMTLASKVKIIIVLH